MKKKLFVFSIVLILLLPLLYCNENNNTKSNLTKLIEKAEELEKKHNKNPEDLNLLISTAEAYQRIGEHIYEYEAQNIIKGSIDLEDIENYGTVPALKELENLLNQALSYYKKAIEIYEDNQFVYSFEDSKDRTIKIYHKDPKIREIYNKAQKYIDNQGNIDESKFTDKEIRLKWEWDQRLNKIVHHKLGLVYRALVPIYLAYKRSAEDNDEIAKWHKKAINYLVEAEKQYKISIKVDSKYKRAYIDLAKLYVYIYEKFQKNQTEFSLHLASIAIDTVFVEMDRNDLEALFVRAKIDYYFGNYVKALRIYEDRILKNGLVTKGSEKYEYVKQNIIRLKEKIQEAQHNN